MADTGSEMAESTTKYMAGIARYLLERHFLWRGGRDLEGERPRQAKEEEGSVQIDVRCPADGFDERVREVLDAMGRAHVRVSPTVDEGLSTLVLSMPAKDAERAQRALERLHASKRSGFSLADVRGLQLVEAVTGRRTRGADTFETTPAPNAQNVHVESTVTFADHPAEPERDRAQAEAYARGMRELGFEASARTVAGAERGETGRRAQGTESVVDVSYPAPDLDDFAVASLVVLHEVGALEGLDGEDPYAADAAAYERDRERLMASAEGRRTGYGPVTVGAAMAAGTAIRDHAVPTPYETKAKAFTDARTAVRRGYTAPDRHDAAPGAKGTMTVEEYDRLPARERARLDPRQIPEGAFGRQGIREVASQAVFAAAALNADREPARTHPAIGERVS